MITGQTKLLGIIGYPVEHSLSPVMQNAAIASLGLDYLYLPFAVHPSDLKAAVTGLAAIGVQGFNVTIPHKQAILPFLSSISDVAKAVGAVNTVWRSDAGWSGANTDVEGFLAPLRSLDRDWSQMTALILGNGGAARSVVAGCAQLGMAQIQVIGRSGNKLTDFVHSWVGSPLSVNLQVHTWSQLPKLLPHAHLLVNTTPIGMAPHKERSPLSPAEIELLPPGLIAYDLIYTPSPTLLLQQAQIQGATIIDGVEMLVQQGAAALQLWLQQSVPVEVMRQSLHHYLAARAQQ